MSKEPKGRIEEFLDRPEQYQAIGKFVFQFSQLEFAIRHLLGDLLELTPSQVSIVAASYDFAALCKVTCSFICDLPELQADADFEKEVRTIFKACLAVNDARVRLVHGTWQETGTSHISRGRMKADEYFKKNEEITAAIAKIKACMNDIVRLIDGPVVDWACELRADIREVQGKGDLS